MDGEELGGLDGTTLVNRITSDVDDTAQGAGTDGNLDGSASVVSGSTTGQTLGTYEASVNARLFRGRKLVKHAEVGSPLWGNGTNTVAQQRKMMKGKLTVHSNCTDNILTQMLLY